MAGIKLLIFYQLQNCDSGQTVWLVSSIRDKANLLQYNNPLFAILSLFS